MFSLVEDVITFFDFISDGTIIVALFASNDVMWMCLTIITVSWPFYVAQVPFLNFKLDLFRKNIIEKER